MCASKGLDVDVSIEEFCYSNLLLADKCQVLTYRMNLVYMNIEYCNVSLLVSPQTVSNSAFKIFSFNHFSVYAEV